MFSFLGSLASANAMRNQADAEVQASEYKARQTERVGQQERAAQQRKALDEKRKTQMVQSSLQAASAASGGGADDPSVVKLASDIEGQGEYNALSQMWTGESRAVALENQANLDRYVGQRKASALRSSADYTILGGAGGLFGNIAKFG